MTSCNACMRASRPSIESSFDGRLYMPKEVSCDPFLLLSFDRPTLAAPPRSNCHVLVCYLRLALDLLTPYCAVLRHSHQTIPVSPWESQSRRCFAVSWPPSGRSELHCFPVGSCALTTRQGQSAPAPLERKGCCDHLGETVYVCDVIAKPCLHAQWSGVFSQRQLAGK